MPEAKVDKVIRFGVGLATAESLYRSFPALNSIPQLRRSLWPQFLGTGSATTVALTFDDGPDPKSTPLILDKLDQLGVKATFFCLGEMVERYPYVLQDVHDRGHDIALHGNWHRNHLFRSAKSIRYDMERGFDTIRSTVSSEPVYFRPPYGVITRPTLSTAASLGLRTVLWGTWGRDWRSAATPASVLKDLKSNLEAGSTILLHDSDCTSAPGSFKSTLGALEPLHSLVGMNGWRMVPLSEHGF